MLHTNSKAFWILFALAAVSFIPTLSFYYVGEEAIHPIIALEMHQSGQWLKQALYGLDIQHIPLYNWLIILFCDIFGWQHLLPVTRGIAVSATVLTALMVAWFAKRLFRDDGLAAFSALAYITLADVLLYRGWLAYVDPLFALLVFSAIALLTTATFERKPALLLLAVVSLTLAFMSRSLTAYVFYGTAGFVLLWVKEYRQFLLRPSVILIHVLALSAPLLWFLLNQHTGHGGRMFGEIASKLAPQGVGAYLAQVVEFPLETFLRLSPLGFVVAYLALRRRLNLQDNLTTPMRVVAWIALLGYLPYWLSPQSSIRYLLPLLPLAAFLAARAIWSSGHGAILLTRNWLIGAIALKFVLALIAFPYYQDHYRGKNYDDAAADILAVTGDLPLYTTDVSASGLNVTAYVDQRRFPRPALQWPPAQWASGYVLARTADPALGQIYKKYQLAADELYLLCRGAACNQPAK